VSIRVGLIGCGEHSEIGHAIPLARYVATHEDAVSLSAACDLRRERAEMFCRQYGFAHAYHDADDMLVREKLDVCIAVTPVERIAEIGTKLLHASIPCVVEKPLGSTIAEVKRLYEVAKTTKTINMVSVNRRFMPLLNQGIDWAKTIGGIRYVRATMLRHARTEPDFLRVTAIHAVDTMRFIAGEVIASEIRVLTAAPPYSYAIDLHFKNGIEGRIDVLPTAGTVEETYELVGDGFCAVIISPFGPERSLRCYQENRLVLEEIIGTEMPEDVIQGFYGEVNELVQALSVGKRPTPSIEAVFPSVELCFQLADRVEQSTSTHGVATWKPEALD
jgi:predicted dehydrogenase